MFTTTYSKCTALYVSNLYYTKALRSIAWLLTFTPEAAVQSISVNKTSGVPGVILEQDASNFTCVFRYAQFNHHKTV